MFLEKLDIIITILAALAVAIVSIVDGANLLELATRLILTILVFFVLGFIMKMYLSNSVFKEEADNTESEKGKIEKREEPESGLDADANASK